MNFSFLTPLSEEVLTHIQLLPPLSIGKKVSCHTLEDGIPDLEGVQLAILGVLENRKSESDNYNPLHFEDVRKAFYGLFPGSWNVSIADLGDIAPGETVEDTYFALKETLTILLENKIIPIILGGSQDLTYVNYRAYDDLIPMVNLVNVDHNFDLGDAAQPITNKSFVAKIIMEEPYNLFNYATIGYQTYFNSQEEIDLMKKLYFEAYRLGEVSNDITITEPVLRDANIVSVDLGAVKSSELSDLQQVSPNGIDGKEICAISRYAGISNKVSSFGIYNYQAGSKYKLTETLIAQMLWYFVEGFDGRVSDDVLSNGTDFQKYITLVQDYELIFYKSLRTGRWWIDIPFLSSVNNKLKKHTLLPCDKKDYDLACNNIVPDRWFKAHQKNNL